MFWRSGLEIFVPDVPGTIEAQQVLAITPKELGRIGLRMALDPSMQKRLGSGWYNDPVGFVAPLKRRRRPPIYIRANFPQANDIPTTISLPTDKEGLVAHVKWHNQELGRLRQAGAKTPVYYPVLFRSSRLFEGRCRDRWGIFMAVEHVYGQPNSTLLEENNIDQRQPLRKMASAMLRYFTDPTRPAGTPIIQDLTNPRQATGDTIHDLDPYVGRLDDELHRLLKLAQEIKLYSAEELIPFQQAVDQLQT